MSEPRRKRSWWKWLIPVAVLVLMVPVIVLLVIRANTEKAWEQYKSKWNSRDPFALSHYAPASVPKSQNLAFHPLFEDLEKSGSAAQTWFAQFNLNPACPGLNEDFMANPATLQRSDLSRITTVSQASSETERVTELIRLNQPTSDRLDQLSEALAERPFYHAPYPWHDALLFVTGESSLPTRGAAHGYLLRATLRIHSANPSGAADDIIDSLRLATTTGQHPTLMNFVLEAYQRANALNALWDGLARDSWNSEDLQRLRAELSTIPPAGERLLTIVRVSRAETLGLLDHVQNLSSGGGSRSAPALARFFLAANRLSYCRDLQECLLAPGGVIARQATRSAIRDHEERVRTRAEGPLKSIYALSLMQTTSFGGAFLIALESEAKIQAARLALEIELHRMTRGSYPRNLKGLAPGIQTGMKNGSEEVRNVLYALKPDGTPIISIKWLPSRRPGKGTVWSYPASSP